MTRTTPRLRSLLAATLALTFIATGCDESAKPDDPAGAARLVASGLSDGDLGAAPVTGTNPTAQLQRTIQGMPGRPAVRVLSVTDGDTKIQRTARLRVHWKVEGKTWTYDNVIALTNTGTRWEVPWSPSLVHPQLRPAEQLVTKTVDPRRADILGSDGRALVTARAVFRIGIDRSVVAGDPAAAARSLARVIGIDAAAYSATVTRSGPKAFVPAITLRAEQVTPAMKERIRQIDGAIRLRDDIPLAPTASFAAPVLGKVGAATAEVVQRSGGTIRPDQQVGLSGLQQTYDQRLRGAAAVDLYARRTLADGGHSDRGLATIGGTPGKPLRITLHQQLQTKAESLLSTYRDKPAAIVAIKPSTGELLAIASSPGAKGLDTARRGRFAPGSTFKIVSSLALIRAGLRIEDPVSCPATISSSGRTFTNFPDYPKDKLGQVPYRTALANSCNTAMIGSGSTIDNGDLASAADALGLTQRSDLAFLGRVPAEDTGAEHDASMIGQGRLLASPLGMATVAASAVAGRRVVPRLVVGERAEPPTPGSPLRVSEAASLRGLMRAVVTEGGGQGLQSLAGPPVLAKTGTAEYGTEKPPGVLSWMIAAQGDLALAVFVQDGGYGGDTCLPLVRAMLAAGR